MAVTPNDADQPPLASHPSDRGVGAAFGHLGHGLAQAAHERAACANPPRGFEKNDCVGAFKPKIERLGVVAVCDPGWSRQQAALLVAPLAF